MIEFYVAISVFLLAHIIPAYKPLRNGLASLMGERPFLAAYGTLSTLLMVWLFWAYFEAPFVELWAFEEWMRWVPLITMPIACILVTTGLGSPNPLSISFIAAEKFDPQHPGIVSLTRHPAVWGLFLWSTSHVIPNGDLAAVLMFSLLSLLALYGPISLDLKRKDRLGKDQWERINTLVKQAPVSIGDIGFGKIALGLLVYGVLLYFHEFVIGVEPIVL